MAEGTRQRLAAILAADAAGYSRLMALDEAATLASLETARAAFRAAIESGRGRVVDMAGDSVLAVFDTAKGAVQAALATQAALDELAGGSEADRRMAFRIGIHLGDVIEKPDGTVYGNGVNIAARLQSLAGPAQVWVSEAVRAAAGAIHGVRAKDQGRHNVKNIAEPVHAFRLWTREDHDRTWPARTWRRWATVAGLALTSLAIAMWWWQRPSPPNAGTAQVLRPFSLSIAPIEADAGDTAAATAAVQLRRDIAAGMASPSHKNALTLLALRAPGSLDTPASTLERARAGGARYLLEGTLRRAGERFSTQFMLSETHTGAQVWSSEWPPRGSAALAPVAPLGVLVDEIASNLMGHEIRRVASLPIEALTPEELWLRGSAIYEAKPTLKGIDEAMVLADRALQLNPQLVPALNLKAFLLLNRYDEDVAPDHDRYARDLDALTARMLAIDLRDLYSWDLRVYALMHAQRWASATEAAETMFQLEGPTEFSVVEKAGFLVQLGRPTEALELLAGNLPTSSKALPTWGLLVTCHARLLMGQYSLAAGACERAAGGNPLAWSVHLYLAAAQAQLGNLERARSSLQVVDRMSPGHTIARLRNYRHWSNPEYRRLAEDTYYAGLRKAGMPER